MYLDFSSMIISLYQKNIIILEINHKKTLQFDEYFSSILCVSNIVTDLPKAFLNLRSFLCICVLFYSFMENEKTAYVYKMMKDF